MAAKLLYEFDGKQIDHGGFLDPDADTHCYVDEKAGVIRCFADTQAFLHSVAASGFKGDVQAAVKKLENTRKKYAGIDEAQEAALKATEVAEHAVRQTAVRALLQKEAVSHKDLKAMLQLHQAGKLGSMIVYDSPRCQGDWAYFLSGTPKLSWFGWNDRISSLYNLGLLVSLHQHTWFRGACLWVPAFACYRYLSRFGWDNRTSSMLFYS